MEQYIEQTVCCNQSGAKRLLYVLLWCLAAVSLLIAAVCAASSVSFPAEGSARINWPAAIGIVAFIGLAYIAWRKKDIFCVDYDYSLYIDEISISAVYNGKRRKQLARLEIKSVRSCGCTESYEYRKIVANRQIVKQKWYINENQRLYFFLCDINNGQQLVLLELNEEMAAAARQARRRCQGSWYDKEGEANLYAGLS